MNETQERPMRLAAVPHIVVQCEVTCSHCGAPSTIQCLDERADGSIVTRDEPHAQRWRDYAKAVGGEWV